MLSKFPDQCKYKGKATVTQHNSPLHIIPDFGRVLRGFPGNGLGTFFIRLPASWTHRPDTSTDAATTRRYWCRDGVAPPAGDASGDCNIETSFDITMRNHSGSGLPGE